VTIPIIRDAELFLKKFTSARRAEHHYHAYDNNKIIKRYKDHHEKNPKNHNNKIAFEPPFKLAHEYKDLYQNLNNREHPFQKYLDNQAAYNECLRIFKRKKILSLTDGDYEQKEIGLLPLEVHLDRIAARMLIRWASIQEEGINRYFHMPSNDMEKIQKKASELIQLLEDYRHLVNSPTRRGIKELSEGKASTGVNPKTKEKWSLNDSHLSLMNAHNCRFRPEKKHKKAGREIIIRSISADYMFMFGLFKLEKKSDLNKNNIFYVGENPNAKPFHNQPPSKKLAKNYGIVRREQPIIHVDVLANLLTLIPDNTAQDISERKIQEIASKQRSRDRETGDTWVIHDPRYHKSPS